jgi:hypothetical protein
MCAFIFYLACRSRATFKFEFESNKFAIYKKIQKEKGLLFYILGFGPKPFFFLNQPS